MTVTVRLIHLLLLFTLVFGTWAAWVLIQDSIARSALRDSVVLAEEPRASGWQRLERFLFTRTPLRRMATRMETAGITWSPLVTLTLLLLAMVVVAVAGQALLGRIGSTIVALMLPMLFVTWLRRAAAKREEAFIAQLPELARIVANGNSAGLSMGRCLAMAGREMAEPAGGEMRRVVSRLDLGWGVDQALTDLSGRMPSRELDVLVRTIVVQARTGGALTKALMDISQALDDRKELRREVATVILGSAVSGYAVIIIGAGAIIMLNLLQPGMIDQMASTMLGRVVLVAAVGLFSLGLILMRLVSRVEV